MATRNSRKVDWRDAFTSEVDTHIRRKSLDRLFAPIADSLVEDGMNSAQISALHRQFLETGGGQLRPEDIPNFNYLKDPEVEEASPPELPVLPSSEKPDFSNVQGGIVSTTERDTTDDVGWWEGSKIAGRGLWGGLKTGVVSTLLETLPKMEEIHPAGVGRRLAYKTLGIEEPNLGIADALRGTGNEIRIGEKETQEKVEKLRNQLKNQEGFFSNIAGEIGAAGLDVANSPTGMLSLVGGPLGAAAIADAYASAIYQGEQMGLEGPELELFAAGQAAPELISLIPAGKLFTKLPIIGEMIENRLKGLSRSALGYLDDKIIKKGMNPALIAAGRTAKAAVGEGAEEAITGTLQDLTNAAFSAQELSSELNRVGTELIPQSEERPGEWDWDAFWENRYRDAMAGAVGGAVLTTPYNVRSTLADVRQAGIDQLNTRVDAAERSYEDARTATPPPSPVAPAAPSPTQGEMFAADTALPTVEEQQAARQKELEEDAAWAIRNKQRQEEVVVGTDADGNPITQTFTDASSVREARREELRTSIQNRVDTARQEVEVLQDRIEDGDVDSATLNSAAAANARLREAETALRNFDESFAPRPAEQAPPRPQPTTTEQAAPVQADLLEGVRSESETQASTLLDQARAKEAESAKKRESIAKAAETKRRKALAAQVLRDHPNMSPQEQVSTLATMLEDTSAQPRTAQPKQKTQEEIVQGVINQVEGLKKRRANTGERRKIIAAVNANPNLTAKEIADQLAAPTQPKTEDEPSSEADIRAKVAELNKQRSLGMSVPDANGKSVQTNIPEFTPEEKKSIYRNKVRDLLGSFGASSHEAAAVHNLVVQGKVILAPSAASVGRAATTDAGEYDTGTGKMFVYLDNLEHPQQSKSEFLKAVLAHEGAHAGQYNPREGRSKIMNALLGDKGNAEANSLIRRLAKDGVPAAKRAAQLAEEAAKNNPDFDGNVENLELVPYLLSTLKEQSPGRLGKVVRDVKAGARQAMRAVGMDMQFSIDEISRAADQMIGEAVKTDIKPQEQGSGTLGMTMGGNAQAAHDTARRYHGAIDGLERWVLSDRAADIIPEARERLLNREAVRLGDVLKHDALYKNYPELADYTVKIEDTLQGLGAGIFYKTDKAIGLSPESVVNLNSGEVRNTLLHETQHAVQEIEGFISGENWKRLEDSRVQGDLTEADRKLDAVIDRFDYDKWESTSPPETVRTVTRALPRDASKREKSESVLRRGLEKESTDRLVNRFGDLIYTPARNARNKANMAANTDRVRAFNLYLRNYGETEARTTEYASNMTQEELDSTDFESMFEEAAHEVPVSETLDTEGYVDGRTPRQRRTLGMSAPAQSNYTVKPAEFSLRERVRRAVETGVRRQTADNKLAEDYDVRIKLATKKDTGNDTISDQMDRDMVTVLTSPLNNTLDGRAKLWNDFGKKYPETVKVLRDIRDTIASQDLEILNELTSLDRPMSVEERKQADAILANHNTYMTRAYAAYQKGRVGSKWARLRWANFEKYGHLTDLSKLNERERKDVEDVRAGIKALEKRISIPPTDVLYDMSLDDLTWLHDTRAPSGNLANRLSWDLNDPDQTEAKREAIINELESIRDNTPASSVNKEAEDMAHAMLGLGPNGASWVKKFSDLTRDPGTLKERSRIPLEARRMLGEIDSAPGAILSTIASQAALKSRALALGTLYRTELGKSVLTPQQYRELGRSGLARRVGESVGLADSAKNKNMFVPAEGSKWGRLEGMYIHKDIAQRLDETSEIFKTWGDVFSDFNLTDLKNKLWDDFVPKYIGTANQYTKLAAVVGTPITWVGNVVGSALQLIDNGNYSRKSWKKGILTSGQYIKSAFNDRTSPKLQEVIEFLNIESSDIADIQRVLDGKLEKYLDGTMSMREANRLIFKASSAPVSALRTAKKGAVAAYSTMDNWTKIANFYHRLGVLQDVYKKAGDNRSMRDIAVEAGHDTSLTNISPERAAKWTRELESRGLSQYLPYFYEVFRTRVAGYQLAAHDLARANQLRRDGKTEAANALTIHATNRLLSHTFASAALPMAEFMKRAPLTALLATTGALALSGLDDDDEYKRQLLSDMNKDQTLMEVGRDSYGMPIYNNISGKFDPFGPFTDIQRIWMNSPDEETRAKALLSYVHEDLIITPRFLKSLYNLIPGTKPPDSMATQLLQGTAMLEAIEEGGHALTVDRVGGVIDNFIPGLFKGWVPRNGVDNLEEASPVVKSVTNSINKGLEKAGIDVKVDPKTALKALNTFGGARFETLDPEPKIERFAADFKEAGTASNSDFNRILLNGSSAPSKETITNAARDYAVKELNRQRQAYVAVKALRGWKFNEDYVTSVIEDKFPKEYYQNLLDGEAKIEISLKSLIGYGTSSTNWMTGADTRVNRDNKLRETIQTLLDMESELNAMGIELNKKGIPKEYQ